MTRKETAHKVPSRPWKKGRNDDYDHLVVEVEVCRTPDGGLVTAHHLQDETDQETALSWPGGGQEEVVYALLVEAARREAILEFLLQMSEGPGVLEDLRGLTEIERDKKLRSMALKLDAVLRDLVSQVALDSVRQAYRHLTQS